MKLKRIILFLALLLPLVAAAESPDGLMKVSMEDGEVWMEIPDSLLGRKLIFGTTVISSSDPRESSVGVHPTPFRAVTFQRVDTLISLCTVNDSYYVPAGDKEIAEGLLLSKRPVILAMFPIEGRSADSTASRCKVTPFFKGDKSYLSPKDIKAYNGMSGYVTRDYDYSGDRSFIKGVSSFGDNVSVDTELSYDVTRKLFAMMKIGTAEPFSATVRSSFALPANHETAPVSADAKIGTGVTSMMEYSSSEQGAKRRYLATKWPVTPEDGNIITFYVAGDMPQTLNSAIDQAAAIWNEGFAKYGYKEAVKICRGDEKDFDDIGYSTIRYIAAPSENIRSSVWCDPSTGFIFSSSILIDNDYYRKVQREAMVMTGLWNENARKPDLPENIVIDRLASSIAHHMGICLGFVPNLAGSSAVPADSLRSVSYTDKNGISNSIMDELSFNYIPGMGDSPLIRMTQNTLGKYDFFAIGWLYGNDRRSPTRDEYRYGKGEQTPRDISCQSGDLGDDAVISSGYALDNLAETARNICKWIVAEDDDYTLRAAMTDYIGERFLTYTSFVLTNIGGVFYEDAQFGNNKYKFAACDFQLRSLRWLISQMDGCGDFDNPDLMKSPDLNVSLGEFLKKELFSQIFKSVLNLPESDSEDDLLTRDEAVEELSSYLWKEASQGKEVEPVKKGMQLAFVDKICKEGMYGYMESTAQVLGKAMKKARTQESKNHYNYMYSSIIKNTNAK